jgi:hypothetical protein
MRLPASAWFRTHWERLKFDPAKRRFVLFQKGAKPESPASGATSAQ